MGVDRLAAGATPVAAVPNTKGEVGCGLLVVKPEEKNPGDAAAGDGAAVVTVGADAPKTNGEPNLNPGAVLKAEGG